MRTETRDTVDDWALWTVVAALILFGIGGIFGITPVIWASAITGLVSLVLLSSVIWDDHQKTKPPWERRNQR